MNIAHWLFWSFVATLLLTTALSGSQGLGLTRMNIPFMLGLAFTADRDRAKVYGFAVHFIFGIIFSLIYVWAFYFIGWSTWWSGAIIGLMHALFVLVVGLGLMPGVHPRMASEHTGPAAHRALEPPGFLALNYGMQTPLSVFLSHAIYGAILGAFYTR